MLGADKTALLNDIRFDLRGFNSLSARPSEDTPVEWPSISASAAGGSRVA